MTEMTCEILAEKLGAVLDNELPVAERKALELHAVDCARCGPLLADLRGLVGEASALPELSPSRDVWSGIERYHGRLGPRRAAAPQIP